MSLKGILSVAGKPGLYKHVAQATNGLIIENIEDNKRIIAHATDRISALEDISMYTNDGDVALSQIYEKCFEVLEGKQTPFNPKKASAKELKELFDKVLPNWDQDRVYDSNIKLCFRWYNILASKGILSKKEEKEEK